MIKTNDPWAGERTPCLMEFACSQLKPDKSFRAFPAACNSVMFQTFHFPHNLRCLSPSPNFPRWLMPHEMTTTWTHPKTSERERKASPPDGSRGQMVDGDRGEGEIEIEKSSLTNSRLKASMLKDRWKEEEEKWNRGAEDRVRIKWSFRIQKVKEMSWSLIGHADIQAPSRRNTTTWQK